MSPRYKNFKVYFANQTRSSTRGNGVEARRVDPVKERALSTTFCPFEFERATVMTKLWASEPPSSTWASPSAASALRMGSVSAADEELDIKSPMKRIGSTRKLLVFNSKSPQHSL